MYNLLVVLHILSAIAWVGGGLTQQLGVIQARKRGGSAEADRVFLASAWMEKYIYMPAPILVVLTGITMVLTNDSWAFSQIWIYSALALIVVAGVLGGAVGGKLEKKIVELRAEDAVGGPQYAEVLGRAIRNGWVELAVMVAIVFLMVYKPIG
jgi:uncharacterized membrane protein